MCTVVAVDVGLDPCGTRLDDGWVARLDREVVDEQVKVDLECVST